MFMLYFPPQPQVKAYGQVPETIPDEDACTSALNLLQMVKEKRIKENKKKKVALTKHIWMWYPDIYH